MGGFGAGWLTAPLSEAHLVEKDSRLPLIQQDQAELRVVSVGLGRFEPRASLQDPPAASRRVWPSLLSAADRGSE